MINLTEKDIKWYNEGQDKIIIKAIVNSQVIFHHIITDKDYIREIHYFILSYVIDLFLKPNSPWEEGFIKWLIDNKKGENTDKGGIVLIDENKGYIFPTKQMLTGYIIEYLESER